MPLSQFKSAMYPDTATLSMQALNAAGDYLHRRINLSDDHPCFKCGYSKGDHIEALANIYMEQDYRLG